MQVLQGMPLIMNKPELHCIHSIMETEHCIAVNEILINRDRYTSTDKVKSAIAPYNYLVADSSDISVLGPYCEHTV